jgi:hypothetical protein
MTSIKKICFFSLSALIFGCGKKYKTEDYSAYFGGEVSNPTNPYVLFCKNSEVIDTIALDKENRFFIKFDSLSPGLYSFKHEPEYQYVYFEKNDSLMVTINSKDFDQSIVFSGRGDAKNNFLMELYLKNEDDRNKMFNALDLDFKKFSKNIDSSFAVKQKFYNKEKEAIQWSEGFDLYAKASLNFFHYSKKEVYPVVHRMRTGENIEKDIPKNFYNFRKNIDFNNEKLTNFSPFVKYLTNMLNNVALKEQYNDEQFTDLALDVNIQKLNIADTLFKNQKIKNNVVNNIAFSYLLEDQNVLNIQKFIERYYKISTDKSKQNEIIKIGDAIQLLKAGNKLPEIDLIDKNNKVVDLKNYLSKKTVIFFWTDCLDSHMIAAHKKVIAFEKSHPQYQFIAINVDKNQEKWVALMQNSKFKNVIELRATNFEELRQKWVINKIHRTLITNADGTINNAFVSLFDVNFEKMLN